MGRLTRIDSSIDEVSQFTYDRTGQLTGAQNTFEKDEAYAYDSNGNRTGTGITNGTANRLLADANYTYTYDAEGNRLTRTDKVSGDKEEYEWDHRNRLTEVTFRLNDNPASTPVQAIRYEYDAFDRRISRTVDTTSPFDFAGAPKEYYGYDGQDVIFDILDPDGPGTGAPAAIQRRYLHGPAVDQILAQENVGGATLWMTHDHLGSVRDVLKNDGTIAAHYQYDSYGVLLDGLENVTRFGYAGYERDAATDMLFTDSRAYMPSMGRMASEDPSGLGPDSNPYRYVHNHPTNFVDPTGRSDLLAWPIVAINGEYARARELDQRYAELVDKQMYSKGTIEPEDFLRRRRAGLDMAKFEIGALAEGAIEFNIAGASAGIGVCRVPSNGPSRISGQINSVGERLAGQIDEVARRRSLGLDPRKGYNVLEEQAAVRLEARLKRKLVRSEDVGDWVDSAGRIYDAVGPVPPERFNYNQFTRQIVKHFDKSVHFVAIDLNGLCREDQVRVVNFILETVSKKNRQRMILMVND